MRTIGIRELKTTISSVLRHVARGDVYLVTDRGRVVAELRPPGGSERVISREERAVSELAQSGQLRLAERAAPEYRTSPLKSAEGTARELLEDERGE